MSVEHVQMRARLDLEAPNQARLSNALLGGRDNYTADRNLVERLLRIAPEARAVAREHREWVGRVLRMLTVQRRVDQFLDLGAGLPTADNTHQIVQRTNAEARVFYVDNDPIVLAHGRALLEENELTHVAEADLTDPAAALASPVLTRHLDLTRPVALMMCDVVHHITDDATALTVVRGWLDALPTGSYLVLTHHFDPEDGGEPSALARRLDHELRDTPLATTHRGRARIDEFLTGLKRVPPGLVPLHDWWPDGPRFSPLAPMNHTVVGVVAYKS
ncbi:SAM-dependent methyltransferase [Actinokineospora sp. PR83]|uniref:SAM-dependent methyltransferase n=1 Tax=Actinokineospora sp. PR83 TaxID=2884908 RepID=UPI001F370861|nr:SAM-dependent methyltransferase [Actinokineospora sp. PR83]MCG8914414.1 SAM-dependent methyltransferase [Actinokineospora sp. PR83]